MLEVVIQSKSILVILHLLITKITVFLSRDCALFHTSYNICILFIFKFLRCQVTQLLYSSLFLNDMSSLHFKII
jgi:hypothetical protein